MNFREDKKVIIPVLLVLAAFVGWKSWKDMHPVKLDKQPVVFDTRYLARDKSSLDAVPDNGSTIVVWAGDIGMKDGKAALTPSPIEPVSIPQREVDPLYVMPEIPKDFSGAYAEIKKNLDLWRAQNNTFNSFVLEYTADKPDLVALHALCNGLWKHLDEKYWIIVALRRDAVEAAPQRNEWLAQMEKSAPMLVFSRKEERKEPESLELMIKNLENLGTDYIIALDEIPDYRSLTQAFKEQPPKRFAAFLLDMTALRKATQ
jgi:hypothetical protein